MATPFIFIHQGFSNYLPFTLRQAHAADPDAAIYLLGDSANNRFGFLHHVDTATLTQRSPAFAEVYRHHSTNRYAFELVCFQRWFRLRAFMAEADLNDALVLDSDVMLYADARTLFDRHIGGRSLGLCIPGAQKPFRWSAFPHVSYWTRPVVNRFCDFLMDVYTREEAFAPFQDKWEYHIQNGVAGGLCDMTALYRFALEHGLERTANFLAVADGTAIDLNLNSSENDAPDAYEMDGGIKRLDWTEKSGPRGNHLLLGQSVAFLALHCQGTAKVHIPGFYRGPRFAGQQRRHLSIAAHYRLRPLASRLMLPLRRLRAFRQSP